MSHVLLAPRRSPEDEPSVEGTLASLEREGWAVLGGLDTGRGVVDHLVTGPGGAFALTVRSQPGEGSAAHPPRAWLRAAREQAAIAAGWLGADVTGVLVLCRAEAERRAVVREGVTVIEARSLAAHLRGVARYAQGEAPDRRRLATV
jgi:hypothetical protein